MAGASHHALLLLLLLLQGAAVVLLEGAENAPDNPSFTAPTLPQPHITGATCTHACLQPMRARTCADLLNWLHPALVPSNH